MQVIITCPISKYSIQFSIEEDINSGNKSAILGQVDCDYKNIKLFLLLLKTASEKLKNQKVNMIQQYVTNNDWNNYLKDKTSWAIEVAYTHDKLLLISCDIDKFAENMAIGLGLSKA